MPLFKELADEVNTCVLLLTHADECARYMSKQWQLQQGHLQQKSHQGEL